MRLAKEAYSPKVYSFRRGKHNLGVTALGEVERNGEYIPTCSAVDLNVLGAHLRHGPSDAEVEVEFDKQRQTNLTAAEYGAVKAIYLLQEVNGGFARVWGGLIDGQLIINLSVEFVIFDDDKYGWKAVRKWIRQYKGIENVMDHSPHLDKSKPAGAKRWEYGKDHGRMQTQIDVIWNVTNMTLAEARQFVGRLETTAVDQKLWEHYGNAVS